MQVVRSLKTWWPQPPFWSGGPWAFVFPLLLVAITTVAIGVATRFVDLGHVGAIYLIAVLISAMRWGLAPALLAATTSVASSAFFFYPPIYSFQVQDWEQLIDLSLFTIVAVVTSQLAVSLNRNIEIADRAIQEARVRAETDHLRDALIGSVSHELRTPLASILGADISHLQFAGGSGGAAYRCARWRGARRSGAIEQRYPEPARRESHQQRRCAPSTGMG